MSAPTKPRIVIDARMVDPAPHGFSRYVSQLADGLDLIQAPLEYEPVFLIRPGLKKVLPDSPVFRFPTCEIGAGFLSPMELLEIPRALKQLDARLYHSPSFSSLRKAPCPWVVTIHDLNHLRFGGFRQKLYYRHLLRPFALHARRLITVSEFSRGEIAHWLEREPETIQIVPNALNPELFKPADPDEELAVLKKHGLERGKFFLCISNPKPHKNTDLLMEAYRQYREAVTAPWPILVNLEKYNGSKGVRAEGPLSEEVARVLLRCAGAVTFPSLYEGFGLPPVEAVALGTPAIVSRIEAHREALADASEREVLWVAPEDANAWALALKEVSNGGLDRVSESTRAKLQVRYSVDSLGRSMDQIYRSMLS